MLPSPGTLLGLDNSQFSRWYPGQQEVFKSIMDWSYSDARFLGIAAPTGSGKTILALLTATLTGKRTCVLTSTKGLQEQYMTDTFVLGGVNVKGQNNFRCTLVPECTAEEGPCHEGLSCLYRNNDGCPYRAQLSRALDANIVVTNYAYYLAQTCFSSGLGDFDLIICDEAHSAFSALEKNLSVYLSRMDVESLGVSFPSLPTSEATLVSKGKKKKVPDGISAPELWSQWAQWAECCTPIVDERVHQLDRDIRYLRDDGKPVPQALSKSYRTAKGTLAKLESLASSTGDWIIQRTLRGNYLFTPRWVADRGDRLFQSTPKVMLMSAILSAKTMDTLGVVEGADRDLVEVGSYFPPENTPIWHIPTTRVNYRSDDFSATIWQARIDQIIQRRMGRKGIIFTVSYDRAKLLLSRSRYKDIMLTHSTGDVSLVVNRFKAMKPPAILVSPTVTTGWDFPGLDYIIVGKVPYPDTKDLVLQARHLDDNDWSSYLAMDTLVQECGRGSRASTDKCEVLCVDDNFVWFWGKYKHFAPKWFQERVRGSLTCVPDPPV